MRSKTLREFKGKSIISLPTNYTVIDIETDGLSPLTNHIIEMSAVRVRNGQVESTFSTLCKPCDGYIMDDFIIMLTRITQDMIDGAPDVKSALLDFINFVGDDVVVGHNVPFDVNFIYDASISCNLKPFSNDHINTVRLAKKLFPELKDSGYSLAQVASELNVDYSNAHRALNDCFICNSCFSIMLTKINNEYESADAFLDLYKKHRHRKNLKASDVVATEEDIDPDNPLYNMRFVFTGVLERMQRKDAMQIVVNHGGINEDTITKKTNYLVLGNNDYCKSIKDGKSTKQKKAEKYKLNGCNIEIIPEDVFYDMIDD